MEGGGYRARGAPLPLPAPLEHERGAGRVERSSRPSAATRRSMSAPRLETASGVVEGRTVAAPDGTPLLRFLGIPYAASPAGARRWQRPAPPPHWAGTRAASAFGPAAPQGPGLPTPLPGFRPERTDEDCLT